MPEQEPESLPSEPSSAEIAQISPVTPTRTASATTVSRSQPTTQTTTKTTVAPKPAAPTPTTTTASTQGAAVIATAKKYIGVKYQWGGTTTSGFDCSGYTQFVYAKHGITLPRISRDQYTVGQAVSISSLQPGDLIFFSLDGDKVIDHVGMYVGGGQFIHASSSKGVTIDNLSSYWTSRTIGAKRVL